MTAHSSALPIVAAEWEGTGGAAAELKMSRGQRLVWSLVFPVKGHRVAVTLPGVFLIGLALGIGTAAYNTASNILFLTLSLLLACLLLSGLLSWLNMRGVHWRLRPTRSWRAGHDTAVAVEALNTKSWLPSYGLFFDLRVRALTDAATADAQPVPKVREALAAAERAVQRGRVNLSGRLEPNGTTALEWVHQPQQRGVAMLELAAVGSLFPFGFLRKSIGTALRQRVLVWPAQIDYQWHVSAPATIGASGRRTAHAGGGDDLFALRKYQVGDSHRLVHWKASARLGRLLVRQFAAETHAGFSLLVDPAAEVWTRPEQFEVLCSFAGTLAEDLFASGRLRGVGFVGEPWCETRRLRDLEAFLDQLAALRPTALPHGENAGASRGERAEPNLITFAPEGPRTVGAYLNGHRAASA